ncbi:hypothetical protein ACKXGD_14500, partial [Enterococcus lactis]
HDSYVKAVNDENSDGSQTYAGAKQALDDYNAATSDAAKNAIADKQIGSGINAEYANAYNTALGQARSSATQGANDFVSSQGHATLAFKETQKIYDQAYKDAQIGFQAGLSNPNAVGANASQTVGIQAAQTYAAGYQQAVAD